MEDSGETSKVEIQRGHGVSWWRSIGIKWQESHVCLALLGGGRQQCGGSGGGILAEESCDLALEHLDGKVGRGRVGWIYVLGGVVCYCVVVDDVGEGELWVFVVVHGKVGGGAG